MIGVFTQKLVSPETVVGTMDHREGSVEGRRIETRGDSTLGLMLDLVGETALRNAGFLASSPCRGQNDSSPACP